MLSPFRSHGRLLSAALALLAVALPLIAGAGGAHVAYGDTIASKRTEARRVQAEIQAFDMKLEATIQRYDGARAHLGSVRRRIRQNETDLRVARHNLTLAQQELSELLVNDYKQGQPGSAAFVLASKSVQQLIDNFDVARRATRAEGDLLHQIAAAEKQILANQSALKVEARQARKLVSQAALTKQRILTSLNRRKQILASLNAGIRHLIQQREARQAKLAAAHAAQAVAPTSPPTAPPSGPAPPANSIGAQAVAIAERYIGVPYVWGGASPAGFDCSGLTMYVYAQLGIPLSHFTGDQWNEGVHVSQDQLAPGDLVFFDGLGHEGMYIGGGEFIHAPHTGDVVRISRMSESWYAQNYDGAVRVTG
jgi:peptidoglycan DL-endopeptidase CwlO